MGRSFHRCIPWKHTRKRKITIDNIYRPPKNNNSNPIAHVIIIIKSEVSTLPIIIFLRGCVPEMFVTSYSVTYCIYIPGKPGFCFHYYCAVYDECKYSYTFWFADRVRLFVHYTISLSSCANLSEDIEFIKCLSDMGRNSLSWKFGYVWPTIFGTLFQFSKCFRRINYHTMKRLVSKYIHIYMALAQILLARIDFRGNSLQIQT